MRTTLLGSIFLICCLSLLVGCGPTTPAPADLSTGPASMGSTPREAETLLKQADDASKAGRMTSAVPLWERVAQNYPNTPAAAEAFYRLGKVQLDQNQPEKALQFFDYLLYTYPRWEGANLARLERLRALSAAGRNRQVMKEAMPLWEASTGNPQVQYGLSQLMADVYRQEGDAEKAFEWASAGQGFARTPEEKQALVRRAMDVLKDAGEGTIQKLYKKNPSPFMAPFLEYQLARIETQKGQHDKAAERLEAILRQNPQHPIATEIHLTKREPPAPARSPAGPTTPPGPAPPLNPNRIGCLVPLNGPYAKFGRLVVRGVSMAVEDWNAKYPDRQLSVVVKDAQAEPDLAVKSFEELVKGEGVMAVIGPLGAQSTKAVSEAANRYGVPLLTLTQKDEEIPASPFVIHVFMDNREMVRSLVRFCKEKLGYTRFATLYPDDRYGQKLSKVFAEVVQDLGVNLLASVSYKEKSTDFKEPLQKLLNIAAKNAPPSGLDSTPFEALFLPDQVSNVALIAPQLPFNNVVGVTLLGTNLWGEAPLVEVGGVYVEQAIFATPFIPEGRKPQIQDFRTRYETTYQTAPSYLEAQGYDAVMLFAQARFAPSGGTPDRTAFLRNLLQIRQYEGIAGGYSFSADGALTRDYFLLQVQNGQLIQLAR